MSKWTTKLFILLVFISSKLLYDKFLMSYNFKKSCLPCLLLYEIYIEKWHILGTYSRILCFFNMTLKNLELVCSLQSLEIQFTWLFYTIAIYKVKLSLFLYSTVIHPQTKFWVVYRDPYVHLFVCQFIHSSFHLSPSLIQYFTSYCWGDWPYCTLYFKFWSK